MAEDIQAGGDSFHEHRFGGDGETPIHSPRPRLPRPNDSAEQSPGDKEKHSAESSGTRPSNNGEFPDRRFGAGANNLPSSERRQFHSNYEKLSPAARELALAIDHYKITHHRRFIDHEEMLQVFLSLGYVKQPSA